MGKTGIKMKNKEILLVTPFLDDIGLYPYLKNLINKLSLYHNVSYLYFPERGYWLDEELSSPFKSIFVRTIFNLIKGCYQLVKLRKYKYDAIIAVDNLPYIVTSALIKNNNIILWSHDFISHDNKRIFTFIQQFILKKTAKIININKRLIIQDIDRRELLEKSIRCKTIKDAFYLPVSTSPRINKYEKTIDLNMPILMQIGGINSFRSGSDELLLHYQKNSEKYRLYLHGFISEEIKSLIGSLRYIPVISEKRVDAEKVYKIVELCDIGFINYKPADLNFKNIFYASGQLAEFMKCGKPVIVMEETNINENVEKHKIGVAIKTINQLGVAIDKILNAYKSYQENCKRCFDGIYNIDKYMDKLDEWLFNK